ncbi:MAG TPA: TolC family outer membrane protein [Gammaproteobacteria bacterium]
MHHSVIRLVVTGALLAGAAAVYGEDLIEVYHLAQQNDPQLRAAEAQRQASGAATWQSRAALLPFVNFSAYTQQNNVEYKQGTLAPNSFDYRSSGYTLSLRQPLFYWDRFVSWSQANAREAQSEAIYQDALQQTMLRVSQAYFNVLSAENNLEAATAERQALEQQLRQTKQRFEVGLAAITDVHEAQAGYDATVAQEIAAQNQLDNSREQLYVITYTNTPVLAPLVEEVPLLRPEPENMTEWVDGAQKQNLQLAAAQAGVEVARQEVNRRQSGHLPTLDLVASHNWTDNTDSPLFGAETVSNIVGLQLNVPILAGGATWASSREASYLYNAALDNLEAQRRSTVRATREAYLGVVAGISQVEARKQALASAQVALEATQTGYRVGTRTAVDVLNAQRQRFAAQRDYSSARYNYILATLRLKQAAGTLNEGDLQQVNSWLREEETPLPLQQPQQPQQ